MIKELENQDLIFKFQKQGDFLSKSLLNNTFYFSSVSNFNDPFESMFNIRAISYNQEGREYFYTNIFPFTCLKNMNPAEQQKFIAENRKSDTVDAFFQIDTKNSLYSHISDFFGVVCFSLTYKEPLMWSHYTSNGLGICQIFNQNLFEINKEGYPKLIKVKYEESLPIIEVNVKKEMFGYNIEPIITTKRSNWAYEKEFRAYMNMEKVTPFINSSRKLLEHNNGQIRNVKYKPDALLGIIFGHKCSEEYIKNTLKEISLNGKYEVGKLKFFQAKVNSWTGLYSYEKITSYCLR